MIALLLTTNSRRNFSSSRDACGGSGCALPLLLPVDSRFMGQRRSRRKSSSCRVSASTFATAKLSSFSFSLKSARIESRSLPEGRGE